MSKPGTVQGALKLAGINRLCQCELCKGTIAGLQARQLDRGECIKIIPDFNSFNNITGYHIERGRR